MERAQSHCRDSTELCHQAERKAMVPCQIKVAAEAGDSWKKEYLKLRLGQR